MMMRMTPMSTREIISMARVMMMGMGVMISTAMMVMTGDEY